MNFTHLLGTAAMALAFPPLHALAQGKPSASGDAAYDVHVRENAPKFHHNFSKGDFEANGLLVTPDIQVNSNNVELVGREAFIQRLERYSVPFPGLQLRDRMIVVQGNVVGVLYLLQGEQKGPYGTAKPTGRKVEAMSGEVFEFNEQVLMKKLTTITKLDDVAAEIAGTIHVGSFQDVTLEHNIAGTREYEDTVRVAAAQFSLNANAGDTVGDDALIAPDIRITTGEYQNMTGRAAFQTFTQRYQSAFPDMKVHDEYVLVDGNHAVVQYVIEGTQTGPLLIPGKSVIAPTANKVKIRGIRFMTFNQKGLLQELVEVLNQDDFATQLNAAHENR